MAAKTFQRKNSSISYSQWISWRFHRNFPSRPGFDSERIFRKTWIWNEQIPKNVELSKYSWVRNPFDVDVDLVGVDILGFQEELIDLKSDQISRDKFKQVSWTEFWAQLENKAVLSREAEKALLPFPTTYLCEQGFSALVVIKTKYRNRLDAKDDLRCALSINIQPNISKLVTKVQHQGSH